MNNQITVRNDRFNYGAGITRIPYAIASSAPGTNFFITSRIFLQDGLDFEWVVGDEYSFLSHRRRELEWLYFSRYRMTLAGLPATTVFAETLRVTTAPAPTTAFLPTLTPGNRMAPPPIHTLSSISIGLAVSQP